MAQLEGDAAVPPPQPGLARPPRAGLRGLKLMLLHKRSLADG